MININTKQLIAEGMTVDSNDLWMGSLHEDWNNLPTPQVKGSIGSKIYKEFLEQSGYHVEIISDQGDIRYRKTELDNWTVDEVKAAKATLKVRKTDNGINEQLWFNQIRPGQQGWQNIVLVGVYPNHIRIWRMDRKTWDSSYKTLKSVAHGLKHTGQTGDDQLEQVTLLKNSKRNNFDEWSCIFTSQQGAKL
tara:strand:- start:2181 stop:2756 length:576 start_codon:yes stop_codon:yes gene_type:complete